MLSPSTLDELASGQRRGILPSLLRGAASLAEIPVGWYVRRRNRSFDEGRRAAHRVEAPVISVGNITTGGTGKTPMVEWIAREFMRQGRRAVLISRGYGSRGSAPNDEARELAARLPELPHLQNPDRVAAAQWAVQEYPGSVLVLDDAFQHRRLHRDLDIVLLDALAPFGFDHLLPRGLLREPVEGLRRAHIIVLSRANLVAEPQRQAIRRRVSEVAPAALWAEVVHQPRELIAHDSASKPMNWLEGRRIAAFCGIGNPLGFRRTLELAGAQIVAWRELPDHAPYTPAQQGQLSDWCSAIDAEAVVCTHKDLVKISSRACGPLPLMALVVGLQFQAGEAGLAAALARIASLSSR
jgi:tetraacyldisaccharide 4'-kinase